MDRTTISMFLGTASPLPILPNYLLKEVSFEKYINVGTVVFDRSRTGNVRNVFSLQGNQGFHS